MATKAKLNCVVKNPNYPGVGEPSTQTVEVELNDDPQFKICDNVPVEFETEKLIFEVRQKTWETINATDETPKAKAVYLLSAFGVKQSDDTIYGND